MAMGGFGPVLWGQAFEPAAGLLPGVWTFAVKLNSSAEGLSFPG